MLHSPTVQISTSIATTHKSYLWKNFQMVHDASSVLIGLLQTSILHPPTPKQPFRENTDGRVNVFLSMNLDLQTTE